MSGQMKNYRTKMPQQKIRMFMKTTIIGPLIVWAAVCTIAITLMITTTGLLQLWTSAVIASVAAIACLVSLRKAHLQGRL